MLKKIFCALAALAALATGAFALTPTTISMYEKAENVALLDVAGGSKSGLYIVFAVILVGMIAFYLYERLNRRQAEKHADGADMFGRNHK